MINLFFLHVNIIFFLISIKLLFKILIYIKDDDGSINLHKILSTSSAPYLSENDKDILIKKDPYYKNGLVKEYDIKEIELISKKRMDEIAIYYKYR